MVNFLSELLSIFVCTAALYVQVASQSTEMSIEKCYTVADNEHCFRSNGPNAKKTWAEARDYCQTDLKGSYSLVAVDDRHVQVVLDHFMDLSDFVHGFVWLGITQRTRGQWSWIDGTRYTGKPSLPSVSDNLYVSGFVQVSTDSRVTIGAENSTVTMDYICQFNESVCEDMKEELWTDGDTCYVPYPQPGSDERRTWYEARNKCLHLNGDLATNGITSVVLRRLETDKEYRTSSRNKRYWIGLQRDPLMKSLSGVNKGEYAPVKETIFRRDSPSSSVNESCIAFEMYIHHQWTTMRTCDEPHKFVCYNVTKLSTPPMTEPLSFSPVVFGGIVAGTAVVCIVSTILILLLIIRCRRWLSHGGNMESNMHTDMTMSIETIPSVSSGFDSSPSSEDHIYHNNRYP